MIADSGRRALFVSGGEDRLKAALREHFGMLACHSPSSLEEGVGATRARRSSAVYTSVGGIYTQPMAKHLIDLDEQALRAARTELGTSTIRDTVNEALRRTTSRRDRMVSKAIDTLAKAKLADRADAWR